MHRIIFQLIGFTGLVFLLLTSVGWADGMECLEPRQIDAVLQLKETVETHSNLANRQVASRILKDLGCNETGTDCPSPCPPRREGTTVPGRTRGIDATITASIQDVPAGETITNQRTTYRAPHTTYVRTDIFRLEGCQCEMYDMRAGDLNRCWRDGIELPRWGFDGPVLPSGANASGLAEISFTARKPLEGEAGQILVYWAAGRSCGRINLRVPDEPEPTLLEQAIANAARVELIRAQGDVDNPAPWKTVAGISAIGALIGLIFASN